MAFGRDEEMQARRIAEMRQMAQASRQRRGAKAAKGRGVGQMVGTGVGMATSLIPGIGPAVSAVATPALAKIGGGLGEMAAGGKPRGEQVAIDAAEGVVGGLAGAAARDKQGQTNLAKLIEAYQNSAASGTSAG